MILIFGGIYQGKLSYAQEKFQLSDSDIYRCSEDEVSVPINKRAVYEFDKWILAMIRHDVDVSSNIKRFMELNPDAVVICNDISCGVVPVDALQRKWREDTGRALVTLSRASIEVYRLFCGIPMRVK
jgi:adenosyl cobinamide kinase/adenosyl cobinamide phosphate guanylyltransferase